MNSRHKTILLHVSKLFPLLLCLLFGPINLMGANEETYRLSKTDQVEMNIFGQPDAKTKQRIDGRGEVTLPLIGGVQIGGLTLQQAEDKIAKTYQERRIFRDPSVSLTIADYSVKAVTVMGEVEEPGEVELPVEQNRLELSKAVAMAGGFTNTAKTSSIQIIRRHTAGGKKTYKVDMDDIYEDSSASNSSKAYLEPGDSVIVPRRIF